MTFKVGDRVRVYGHLCRRGIWESTRWTGADATLIELHTENYGGHGMALIKLDNAVDSNPENFAYEVSPAQCRRLKKKERRRVWILEDTLDREFAMARIRKDDLKFDKEIEFVEVKK